MSTRRFLAVNMQAALKQIRESLGADAQILSSRQVDGGVEVICAPADCDPWAAMNEAENTAVDPAPEPVPKPQQTSDLERKRLVNLEHELASLRQMLAGLPQQIDASRKQVPAMDDVSAALGSLGFSGAVIAGLRRRPEAKAGLHEAVSCLLAQVCFPVQDWLRLGGAHALVGPAGAGKTTTIAKLATTALAVHGRERIALVSIDRYRLAATQQLSALGRILQLPVLTLGPQETLDQVLDQLADKSLVLIDTAGLNPSDPDWRLQLEQLATRRNRLQRHLVLPATSQARVQQSALQAWSGAGLHSVVLSKLDEATSLGESLSLLLGAGLEWSWLTDGQSLSGHLHRADSESVLARILRLWREKSTQALYTDNARGVPAQHAG